ncbi:hypothetical protein HYV50_00780 [Candidatus Pacearchaeota archaeon]|nr:hypothetical protein [Candidatus Pacearchaeota archaeon]
MRKRGLSGIYLILIVFGIALLLALGLESLANREGREASPSSNVMVLGKSDGSL